MPTYEYACSGCGHHWEDFQKISAEPTKECPNCHQQTAQRQISGGNFILKGGGWYADLYSSSSKKSSAAGEKSGEKPSESADTSAASKPAEKSGEKSGGGETKSETKSTAPPPATTPSSGKSD
jgi:putative FmdB family regulatory protein